MNTNPRRSSGDDSAPINPADDTLGATIRPALGTLIAEAAERSASMGGPFADMTIISADTRQARTASKGPTLAIAAALALLVGGGVAVLRASTEANSTDTPNTAERTSVADTPTSSSMAVLPAPTTAPQDGTFLRDLLDQSQYQGSFAVIDPTRAPEFGKILPEKLGPLDRWLLDGDAANRAWAVRADVASTGEAGAIVSWRAPVAAPARWRVDELGGGTTVRIDVGSSLLLLTQTKDGTWLEASVDLESSRDAAIEAWFDSLAELASARDDVPPPSGYIEVPAQTTETALRYRFATSSPESWVDVVTVDFETDLTDAEARSWFASFGKLEPILDFNGSGLAYQLRSSIDEGDDATTQPDGRIGWQPNSRQLVLVTISSSLASIDSLEVLDALRLNTDPDIGTGVKPSLSFYGVATPTGGPAAGDTLVYNVRAGSVGDDRVAYFEQRRGVGDDAWSCAQIVRSSASRQAACTAIVRQPLAPLCAYRTDPLSEISPLYDSGFRVVVIADLKFADDIVIASKIDGADVDVDITESIADDGVDERPTIIKSAFVPSVPTVTLDGADCVRLQ